MRICVNDEMDKPAVLHQKMQIKSPTIETYRWASKVYSRLDATSFLIVLASADFLYQRGAFQATFLWLNESDYDKSTVFVTTKRIYAHFINSFIDTDHTLLGR